MSTTSTQRVLVTGAGGFVGSRLVELLASDPRSTVIATDSGGQERLEELAALASVTSHAADLRDTDALRDLVSAADVVVHLAAVRTTASSKHPRLAHEVNVGAMYDLLAAARDAGTRRVVFGSSHTVYGSFQDHDRSPVTEDEPWIPAGINMYAATKLAAEAYLEAFAGAGGPDYLALRLGTIYGPRSSAGSNGSLMTGVLSAIRDGEPPRVPWSSTARHGLIHVDDIAESLLRATFSPATRMAVNVSGAPRTSAEIYGTLARLAGGDPASLIYDESRTRHQLVDRTRMRTVLDFTPQVGLEEGLRSVVDWHASAAGTA
ncbi:NAD(P)-dependent oxidoreductase [Tsukamurella sp. PLM1]|uniref:NAD-dependent epimerase/dehydratase family protein n=1 Tax=Tsukamurella sp. PLM1 TaxID=2929795 RepID=UPI0020500D33|nr:NAD(P)-dependent oxidoreductase [Tsukamurella sp. PLM1]BDH56549.1 NAD-dependent dehydratase [Tsukamurella sp. PLM1]